MLVHRSAVAGWLYEFCNMFNSENCSEENKIHVDCALFIQLLPAASSEHRLQAPQSEATAAIENEDGFSAKTSRS